MLERYAALALSFLAVGCAGVGAGQGDGSHSADAGAPADLSVSRDLRPPPPDFRPPPDLRGLVGLGLPCGMDSDCASGLCRPLGDRAANICVMGCKGQPDCTAVPGTFCAPKAAGAADGYCVVNSANHCATCGFDSDCGVLADRCLLGPGDNATACHIDCSLAGAAACPSDYSCTAVNDGGNMRKLCMPKGIFCLDSLGGFCDRTSLPQPCARANAAGICTGTRQCLQSGRFDRCGATAPQYKMSCSDLDPAGCTLSFAPGATSTPNNCGSCGNACPGLGLTNNDVVCQDPSKKLCGQTCRGENYDVDNNLANGCERLHTTPPGHTEATASDRGHKDCFDGASTDDFGNNLLSDSRVHMNPAVGAFSGTVGSAPDYWSVEADGGLFCVDDYSVTFTTSGGGATACYTCTIITNKMSQSVTVSGSGSANMSSGSGSYSDGTTVYFKIEKTCKLPVQEAVNYTVHYHL